MYRQALLGVVYDDPYPAVGMQSASQLAIGLPRRPTIASWILALRTPPDVRRSFTCPPELIAQ
jgi:hypothetical protein